MARFVLHLVSSIVASAIIVPTASLLTLSYMLFGGIVFYLATTEFAALLIIGIAATASLFRKRGWR